VRKSPSAPSKLAKVCILGTPHPSDLERGVASTLVKPLRCERIHGFIADFNIIGWNRFSRQPPCARSFFTFEYHSSLAWRVPNQNRTDDFHGCPPAGSIFGPDYRFFRNPAFQKRRHRPAIAPRSTSPGSPCTLFATGEHHRPARRISARWFSIRRRSKSSSVSICPGELIILNARMRARVPILACP
jgi:hypothetical protein